MDHSDAYRVVYVEPGKPACVREIGSDLKSMREAVVGGPIECVYAHRDNTLIVCNDEGKLIGLKGNRRLENGSIIAGPFFVVGAQADDFRSLTEAEVERYLHHYAQPHEISQKDVQADMRWTFILGGMP